MTDQDMKRILKGLFVKAQRREIDPTGIPDSGLVSHLGIDSISSLEILILVEQAFDIEIADADLDVRLVDSLDVLVEYLKSKGATAVDAPTS